MKGRMGAARRGGLAAAAVLAMALVFGAAPAPARAASYSCRVSIDILEPGQGPLSQLTAGGVCMRSNDGHYALIMQGDGNLVEYVAAGPALALALGRALWSSGTQGNPGAYAVMQGDGNLVVDSSGGMALWDSRTGGNPGAYAVMQGDANLVVYASGGTALWGNNKVNDQMDAGDALTAGQFLQSADRHYQLVMQDDGNLVEYVERRDGTLGRALWSSGTQGNPGAYAVMQEDGNLVVFSRLTALWDSRTGGNPGAHLSLQDDANLVLYSGGGTVLWANYA